MIDPRPGDRTGRGVVFILNHLEFFARLIPSRVIPLRPTITGLAISPLPIRFRPGNRGPAAIPPRFRSSSRHQSVATSHAASAPLPCCIPQDKVAGCNAL